MAGDVKLTKREREYLHEIHAALTKARAEIERLQSIIDSRPAINAGLPETYIQWSQLIYEMEAYHIVATPS